VDKVVEFDMAEAEIKWFTEAKVNIKKLHRQTS
jgi:acetyl-CoA synthetase